MNPLRIWLSRPPVVHLVLCTGALIAFLLLTLVAGGFPPRTWQSFGQALAALPHLARGQGVVGPALWSLLLGIQALCLLAAWGLLAFLFVQQGYALVEVTRRGRAPGGATRPPLIVSDYRAEDAQSETERMAAVLSEEERDAAASASTNMARAEPANPYDTERLDERVPGASLHTPPLFFPQEAVPNTSDLFGQASPHAHPSRDEERVSPKPLLLPGVQEEEARRPQPQPDGAATNQQEERPTPAPPQTGEGERTRISPQERLETAFRDLLARDIPLEKITIDMLRQATHVKRDTVSRFLREKKGQPAIPLASPLPLEAGSTQAPPQSSPPQPSLRGLQAAMRTSPGVTRAQAPNEDASLSVIQGGRGLFVVADGMGGHAHGREASQVLVQTLSQTLASELDTTTEEQARDLLVSGVEQANQALYTKNSAVDAQGSESMGTTVTATLVVGANAYIVNVGDSRTYWQSQAHGLVRVTRDHSQVESLIAEGSISEAERYTHPERSHITRCLGIEETVEIDAFFVQLQAGDRLLLCSDGLWEMLPDQEWLARTLASRESTVEQTAIALLDAALAAGGLDNVTVIVVSWHGEQLVDHISE